MRILILTGKFNMGHLSASQSLRRQLMEAYPGAQVEVTDFVTYALPRLDKAVYKLFQVIMSRGTHLYNAAYRRTEKGKGDMLPFYILPMLRAMKTLLREENPDIVISTHPTCSQLLSRCKGRSWEGLFLTCITDVTDHAEWICKNCDGYYVAADSVKEALVGRGIPPERISVTGIPVRREFKHCRIPPLGEEKRLLIMGGGAGVMPQDEEFYRGVNSLPGVKTTLITGNNRALFDKLVGKYPNVQVLGFTQEVYKYMGQSDLVLSKPGGVTTFEAIFSATPMLIWDPVWEQERRNADFLLSHGMGRVTGHDSGECLGLLRELLSDGEALAHMSRRMGEMARALDSQGPELLLNQLLGGCAGAEKTEPGEHRDHDTHCPGNPLGGAEGRRRRAGVGGHGLRQVALAGPRLSAHGAVRRGRGAPD